MNSNADFEEHLLFASLDGIEQHVERCKTTPSLLGVVLVLVPQSNVVLDVAVRKHVYSASTPHTNRVDSGSRLIRYSIFLPSGSRTTGFASSELRSTVVIVISKIPPFSCFFFADTGPGSFPFYSDKHTMPTKKQTVALASWRSFPGIKERVN